MFDNPILLAVPLVSLVTGYFGGKRVLGVLTGVLGFALAYVTTYMTLPTLALDFYDLPTLFLFASLPGILASVLRLFLNENHMGEDIRPNPFPAFAVLGLSVLFLAGQFYSTLGFRNPDAYRKIIEVTERPLDHTVELIDQTHARVIDQDLAKRRALELLGTEVGLGSSYDVGTPTVQQVNGRQVWVAPLEPAGFWVWQSGKPSPGYVVVSTTNYTDASIHLDRPIKYGNGMWFGDNIERLAYRLAPTRGQTDPSFEIDETGHPYWVVSLYTHTIGAGGPKVDGVMVVDAATGGARTYGMNEIPAWVDRVQPEWVSELQVQEWGDYVHGWWNFGKIDIVVCNAATNPFFGPMAKINDDQFRKILDNNIIANNWLIQMAAPQMRERKEGAVIIISSIGGLRGSTGIGAYNISKAADFQLARSLAVEWGPKNIRVNCIAPGLVKTEFARALWEDEKRLDARLENTPLRRIGEPDDIGGIAAFLASRSAAFITGQVIVADGGVTIG